MFQGPSTVSGTRSLVCVELLNEGGQDGEDLVRLGAWLGGGLGLGACHRTFWPWVYIDPEGSWNSQ